MPEFDSFEFAKKYSPPVEPSFDTKDFASKWTQQEQAVATEPEFDTAKFAQEFSAKPELLAEEPFDTAKFAEQFASQPSEPVEPPPALAAPTTTRPTNELDERGFVSKTLGAIGSGLASTARGVVGAEQLKSEAFRQLGQGITSLLGDEPSLMKSAAMKWAKGMESIYPLKPMQAGLKGIEQRIAPDNTAGILDSVKAGRYGEAAGKLWYNVLQNAPSLAISIASRAHPGIGLAVQGQIAAGNKYTQLTEEYPDMPYAKRAGVALTSGLIEGLSERLGTMRIWKGLLAKDATRKAVQMTVGEVVRRAIKAGGGEAGEEVAAQISNNILDMLAGVRHGTEPARWNDGVSDAALTAFFLGGAAAGAHGISQRGKLESPPEQSGSTPPETPPIQPTQPAASDEVDAARTFIDPRVMAEMEAAQVPESVAAQATSAEEANAAMFTPEPAVERGGAVELRHYTNSEITEPTKPDANGLVWFTEGQSYLKGPPKTKGKWGYVTRTIPENEILRIDETPGMLEEFLASPFGKDGRSKARLMEFAESKGYRAVKSGNDVAMRVDPTSRQQYVEPDRTVTENELRILTGEPVVEQDAGVTPSDGRVTVRHAWEMTRDELQTELESATDKESLARIRPLLAEVFPEYVGVDYRDFNQDPWGIGRAIQVGTELPRIPTVDLTKRHNALVSAAPAPAEAAKPERVKTPKTPVGMKVTREFIKKANRKDLQYAMEKNDLYPLTGTDQQMRSRLLSHMKDHGQIQEMTAEEKSIRKAQFKANMRNGKERKEWAGDEEASRLSDMLLEQAVPEGTEVVVKGEESDATPWRVLEIIVPDERDIAKNRVRYVLSNDYTGDLREVSSTDVDIVELIPEVANDVYRVAEEKGRYESGVPEAGEKPSGSPAVDVRGAYPGKPYTVGQSYGGATYQGVTDLSADVPGEQPFANWRSDETGANFSMPVNATEAQVAAEAKRVDATIANTPVSVTMGFQDPSGQLPSSFVVLMNNLNGEPVIAKTPVQELIDRAEPPPQKPGDKPTPPPPPPPNDTPTPMNSIPDDPGEPAATGKKLVKPAEVGVFGKAINWIAGMMAFGPARLRIPSARLPILRAFRILDSAHKVAVNQVNEVLRNGEITNTSQADMNVSFALDEGEPWRYLGLRKTPESVRQHKLYDVLSELRDETTDSLVLTGAIKQETVDAIKEEWGGYMPRGPMAVALVTAFQNADAKQKTHMSNVIRDSFRQRKGELTMRELATLLKPETKLRLAKEGLTPDQIRAKAETFTLPNSDYLLDRNIFNPVYLAYVMQTNAITLNAMRMFIGAMKDPAVGLAVPENSQDIAGDDNYVTPGDNLDGVVVNGLKGYKVHKMGLAILNEFAEQRRRNATAFDKALSITKQGQFYNPGVLISYNILAPYLRGVGDFRFWKIPSVVNTARKDTTTGAYQLQQFLKLGGAPSPMLATQATADEHFLLQAQKMRSDLAGWKKGLSRIFQTPWGKKQKWTDTPMKTVGDAIMLPYRAIGGVTWSLDELQRYAVYVGAMESNLSKAEYQVWRMDKKQRNQADPDVVRKVEGMEAFYSNRVGKAMGDYSFFSAGVRQPLSRIFFVYTFRFVQPLEQLKTVTEPFVLLYRQLAKAGKHKVAGVEFSTTKPEAYEWKTSAKSLGGTVAVPLIIYGLMKDNGWEPEEEGAPDWLKKLTAEGSVFGMPIGVPLGLWKNYWKYKKTITTSSGEKRELVVGLNTLTNMPIKWFTRLTVDKPQVIDATMWHLWNAFKWEIHPMYRVALDAYTNEPSMGQSRPRDPVDPPLKQLADTSAYVYQNLFRLYGALMDIGGSGDTAFQRKVEQDLKNGLNAAEKMFLGSYAMSPITLGYTYSRADKRKRYGVAMEQLERAIAGAKSKMKQENLDRPEVIQAQTARLNQILVERKRRLYKIFMGEMK